MDPLRGPWDRTNGSLSGPTSSRRFLYLRKFSFKSGPVRNGAYIDCSSSFRASHSAILLSAMRRSSIEPVSSGGAYTGPRIFDLDGFDRSIPKCFNELFISGFEADE